MEILLISVAFGAFSSIVTVFILKKINKAKLEVFIEQAKAKARVIEHEAEVALKDAQLKAKFECDREFKNARKEYENMLFKIEKKEKELNEHLENELRLIKAQKEEMLEKFKNHSFIVTLPELSFFIIKMNSYYIFFIV